MDRGHINQKLQEFSNRIDRIIGMFDENLTKRGAIAIEYARLKDDLKIEKDKFQTQQGWDHASEDERKFYSPAVEEAYIELNARSGSSPSRKVIGNLTAARIRISSYLDQPDYSVPNGK